MNNAGVAYGNSSSLKSSTTRSIALFIYFLFKPLPSPFLPFSLSPFLPFSLSPSSLSPLLLKGGPLEFYDMENAKWVYEVNVFGLMETTLVSGVGGVDFFFLFVILICFFFVFVFFVCFVCFYFCFLQQRVYPPPPKQPGLNHIPFLDFILFIPYLMQFSIFLHIKNKTNNQREELSTLAPFLASLEPNSLPLTLVFPPLTIPLPPPLPLPLPHPPLLTPSLFSLQIQEQNGRLRDFLSLFVEN